MLDAAAIRAGLERGELLCPECGDSFIVHFPVRVNSPCPLWRSSAALAAAHILAEEVGRLEWEKRALLPRARFGTLRRAVSHVRVWRGRR
jgi:hypothetical protein